MFPVVRRACQAGGAEARDHEAAAMAGARPERVTPRLGLVAGRD